MSAKWIPILLFIFPSVFSLSPDVLESWDCIDYGDYVHWIGGVGTPGTAQAVAVSGSYAYVTVGSYGLHILPIQCAATSIDDVGTVMSPLPQAFHLSQNYPNPFNPTTTISFDIRMEAGAEQHVNLTIYDLRGRHVKTLIDDELEQGSHEAVWDGKDEQGQQVSSGIYLYTLKSGEKIYTRKMAVVE